MSVFKRRISVVICSSFMAACGGGNSPDSNSSTSTFASGSSSLMPDSGAGSQSGSQGIPLGSALAGQPLIEVMPYTQGALSRLSDDEFNSFTAIEQYRLANRLASTLYRGISLDEFLDVSQQYEHRLSSINDGWLSDYYRDLQTPLTNEARWLLDERILGSDELNSLGNDDGEYREARYSFSNDRPRELPLARIHNYPVSLDQASQWMAWHLSNTLLFSPSSELDSAGMTDVQNVMRRLDKAIIANQPVSEVVFQHMRSQENWRRFRSPEDNTREMMEVYLGLEEVDEEVPAASIACQDLYLTTENDGYQLAYTDFPNSEPQSVLGSDVVNCDDFYRAVANHERLMPTVAGTLVSYFFSTRDPEFKQMAVQQLLENGAESFSDLFLPIIFSRAYLLETERVRSFEESFLPLAERVHWRAGRDLFKGLASGRGEHSRGFMLEMGWPAMSSKLGRSPFVPTDSLSFANYHKAIREEILIKDWRWRAELGIREPEPPEPAPLPPPPEGASAQAIADYQTVLALNEAAIAQMSDAERSDYRQALQDYERHLLRHENVKAFNLPEFVDYLFLSVVMRKAHPEETSTLVGLFHANDWLRIEEEGQYLNRWNRDDAAKLVMDYLSRLPELYYHTAFENAFEGAR